MLLFLIRKHSIAQSLFLAKPMMDADQKEHKAHRVKKSGRKAEKKAKKVDNISGSSDTTQTAKQRNPKAFAVQNVTKLKKRVRR